MNKLRNALKRKIVKLPIVAHKLSAYHPTEFTKRSIIPTLIATVPYLFYGVLFGAGGVGCCGNGFGAAVVVFGTYLKLPRCVVFIIDNTNDPKRKIPVRIQVIFWNISCPPDPPNNS